MPETPKRQLLLTALVARLAVIEVRNGFNTDAGRQIYVNETPALSETDPPEAIAIVAREDQPGSQMEKIVIGLPIEFQALAKVTAEREAWMVAEAVLGDIKRAIELVDRTLGGLILRQFVRGSTRVLERPDGSRTAGVGILYTFPYAELWGTP